MEKPEFKRLITDIFTYFGRKLPETAQVDQMARKMENVPGTHEIVLYLYNQFTDHEDSPLGNVPKKLKNYWYQWQSQNHHKIVVRRTDCKACDGSGMIIYFKNIDGIKYRQAAVCGECDNWQNSFSRNHGIPVLTRSAVIANGYELYEIDQQIADATALKRMLAAANEVPF